jgi:hypothetical protein
LNFTSYGTKSDQFVDAIDIDSFNTIAEAMNFFASNSKWVDLIEDTEAGTKKPAYTIQAKYITIPERYVMNENCMYKIGETVYKLFPEANKIVATVANNTSNVQVLKNAVNVPTSINNSDCAIFNFTEKQELSTNAAGAPMRVLGTMPSIPANSITNREFTVTTTISSVQYRTRLILDASEKTIYAGLTVVAYQPQLEYTLVVEQMKKALGFLWTFGKNVSKPVSGSITVYTKYCLVNSAGNWTTIDGNQTWTINETTSKKTEVVYANMAQDAMASGYTKPWHVITDWNVNLQVSGGANLYIP